VIERDLPVRVRTSYPGRLVGPDATEVQPVRERDDVAREPVAADVAALPRRLRKAAASA
jgi:hypothetical protein